MNAGDANFTVKEIVIDIRDTVKALAEKVDRIDEQGSIGTREQLRTQSQAIQDQDKRLAVLESRPPVTRQDIHDLKAEIAALKLWQAGLAAVSGLKRWQITVGLGLGGIVSGVIGAVATLVWLGHG